MLHTISLGQSGGWPSPFPPEGLARCCSRFAAGARRSRPGRTSRYPGTAGLWSSSACRLVRSSWPVSP